MPAIFLIYLRRIFSLNMSEYFKKASMEMTAQVVTFHSIFSRERLIEASFVVLLYSQQPGFALVFGVHFVTKIMTIIQAH